MKKSQNLLPALISLIIIYSCQKDTSQDQNGSINGTRVKTYTESIISPSNGNSSHTFSISYDNEGRIISMVSAGPPVYKLVYSFPSSNKFTMDMSSSGDLLIHEDFYLNGNLFIDSTFQYNDTKDTSTEKYFYDVDQRLVRMKEYEYTKASGAVLSNTITYSYDAAGDMVKASGTDTNVEIYEYYTDSKYLLPMVPGPITPKSLNKVHLPKRITLRSNGAVFGTADVTYTFDGKDRVTTQKAVADDGSIAVKTYTYF